MEARYRLFGGCQNSKQFALCSWYKSCNFRGDNILGMEIKGRSGNGLFKSEASSPVEILVSYTRKFNQDVLLILGLGRGLNKGMG